MIKNSFIIIITFLFAFTSLHADFYYSGGKKHILKKVKTSRANGTSNQYSFQTQFGDIITVNKGIIVSYSDKSIRKSIEQKYNLHFVKNLINEIFLYRVEDVSKTVETANLIYEEDGVKFCHPDFQRTKKNRDIKTNDPFIWDSWHLFDHWHRGENRGDINIEQAWKYTKGEGVKVAVYDKGIDINHDDLRENIIAFRNYNDSESDIPYSDDDREWHGTACAGIISARENRIGSVGIAPEASLYAIGYSETNASQDIEAFKWMMDEGVSVINNSWGSYSALDAYTEIFKLLATEGRNGKGIILVFAAGNANRDLDDEGINDESESPYVFSVAASTRNNTIASYSNYGEAVDFTAPGGDNGSSGIITTDASGSLGYNSSDYNNNFVGTSAAAPMLTGTVTLMLSANPKLTRDDIFKILKSTVDKKGNYQYDENGHNNHWGYGKINAGAAVKAAYLNGKSNLKNFARTMFNSLLD